MTSKERKEARYQRRHQKRLDKVKEISDKYSDLNRCFTFSKAMYYADKCSNGVRWKSSTKRFNYHLFTNIATTCYRIKNNCYITHKTYKFTINERGKTRDIDAPHILDRLVHKIITNEILIPIYDRHLIYDNGASIRNKGFKFTLDRVKLKARETYKKNKDAYVILIDYSKYFENCSHIVIKDIHKRYIFNDYTIKVIEDYLFIGKGIALGVEIAQKESQIIPNYLDHYISNKYKLVRYMDDTIAFVDSYDKAVKMLKEYIEIAKKYNIKININKSKIIKINNIFSYCKWKFIFKENRLVMITCKDTIYRQRRKLRKLKINNIKEIKDIYNCYKAYLNYGNSYNNIRSLSLILL